MGVTKMIDAHANRRSALKTITTGSVAAALGGADAMAAGDKSAIGATRRKFDDEQVETSFLTFDDPVEEFEAHFRFERDLVAQQGIKLSWYHWMVYIVPEDQRPQPILRYEGIEFSYFRKVAENTYRIHAHNLSYPRDLKTTKFTDTVLNPLTGETVKVNPTVLLSDPGTVQSPKGFRNLNGDGTYVAPYWQFRREDQLIKLDSVRTAPPNWPAVFMESSTQWVDYASFKDKSITALPSRSSAVYVFPYPEWLKMKGQRGHMLGFIDARRVTGPSKLPKEFFARTQREYPELLSPRWGEFDRPSNFDY